MCWGWGDIDNGIFLLVPNKTEILRCCAFCAVILAHCSGGSLWSNVLLQLVCLVCVCVSLSPLVR